MKKKDLIKRISGTSLLKKKNPEKIFYRITELISGELKRRKPVMIEGFGEFQISDQGVRIELKSNGKKTVIPPRSSVSFIPAKELINSDS